MAGLLVAGWPVALLAFAFPWAAFVAALAGRRRRLAAALLALLVPVVLALSVPESRFFVVAVTLAVVAALVALRAAGPVGYAELSVSALMGLAAASAIWLLVDPELFVRLRTGLEASTLEQGRSWLAWMERGGALDANARARVDAAIATSAEMWARTWPVAAFLALWTGLGSALGLAAWSTGKASPIKERASAGAGGVSPPTGKVRVFARCSGFRAPDAWVWVFLLAMAAFLALPGRVPARDAALNLALASAAVFAWQGVAVVLYYLERRGVRALPRLVLFAALAFLLAPTAFVMLLCLGLADVRFDFRARGARDAKR